MIPLPYRILAAVLLFGAATGGAYLKGRGDGRALAEGREAWAQNELRHAVDQAITGAQAADLLAVTAAQQSQTIFREIRREVPTIIDRPVYRNVCVDADGVRALDRAVDAANGRGTPAGGPDDGTARIREGADRDRPGNG